MKMTLLEMVQDILNDLDSDEVNNIDDTVESQQVAQIIKTCYFEMMGNRNWPHLRKLIQLEPSNDLARPNYLQIPDNLKEIEQIEYNIVKDGTDRIEYRPIKYVPPDVFLRRVASRNSTLDNIELITDYSGSELLILNDVAPSVYTSFDDKHIVFDSYNRSVDDTLKKSKTRCLAYMHPVWDRRNEAIADLPSEAFPSLLNEAKRTAFVTVKQMVNQNAEQKAARQQRWLSRKAWSVEGGVRYPNYGRRSNK